jgi:hypothetical protein
MSENHNRYSNMIKLVRERVISDLKELGEKDNYFFSEGILANGNFSTNNNYVIRGLRSGNIFLDGAHNDFDCGLEKFITEDLIWVLKQIEEKHFDKEIEDEDWIGI